MLVKIVSNKSIRLIINTRVVSLNKPIKVLTIPGIVNTFIGLFKDTTLVFIISLMDLLLTIFTSNTNPDWMGFPFEGYIFAASVYFIICFSLSRYSLRVENKLMVSKQN